MKYGEKPKKINFDKFQPRPIDLFLRNNKYYLLKSKNHISDNVLSNTFIPPCMNKNLPITWAVWLRLIYIKELEHKSLVQTKVSTLN
jgi:hypothetical protein